MRNALAMLGATTLLLVAVPALAQNRPPVAFAGPDLEMYTDEVGLLRGSATDPDNDTIVDWLWTIESAPAGSPPILSDPQVQYCAFLAFIAGDYVLSLIVSDGLVWSQPDYVTIKATDLLPPVAIATADVIGGPAPLTVHFDGSLSYDPQGGSLFIDWDFGDQTAGSNEFNPTHVYEDPGDFLAVMTVIDDLAQADVDTIAHELGHTCDLRDNKDSTNLMGTSTGTDLTNVQIALLLQLDVEEIAHVPVGVRRIGKEASSAGPAVMVLVLAISLAWNNALVDSTLPATHLNHLMSKYISSKLDTPCFRLA